MEIPGAALQLETYIAAHMAVHMSSLASAITADAKRYQDSASDNRLGLPRVPNTSLAKANLARASQVLQERKDRKDLTNKLTVAIHSYIYSQVWNNKKKTYGAMTSVGP